MLHVELPFGDCPMNSRGLIAVLLLATATVAAAGDRKFTASSVPSARMKKPGKIVISNDHRSITAHRFYGDIREALVSLRSTRVSAYRPFGSSVFDSRARLSTAVPPHLASLITDAARTHGVDPRLVTAIARRESAFRADVVSRAGACGIMQLMPATAQYLGVRDIFDARENIHGGTRYLRTLLDTFHGDLDLTLAAYNAGPGAVARYKGVPPYRETREYVKVVRASYERALAQ
jgi:soluble lytic murein transglycosylase-like protein